MTFDVSLIFQDTISGIIVQLPIFIILLICARIVAREIRLGIKQIPYWMETYFKYQAQEKRIVWAKEGMK
jgi:hypothetical protein